VKSVTFANAVDRACIELSLGTIEQTEGFVSVCNKEIGNYCGSE
jgi:hypothetical protein